LQGGSLEVAFIRVLLTKSTPEQIKIIGGLNSSCGKGEISDYFPIFNV